MTKDDILAIARHIATLLGAFLVQHGYSDSDTAQQIAGGVVALAAIGWSLWQKRRPSDALLSRAAEARGQAVVSTVAK